MNFPNASPFHGLQFFVNCSSVGHFHGVQFFKKRLHQRGSPMGSQILANLLQSGLSSFHGATCPARSLLQCELPMGSQPPSGHIHLLWCGVLHGLQVDVCYPVVLRELQGDSLTHRGLHNVLCSCAWSTSSPFISTGLGVCRVVHIPTRLSHCSCCCEGFFILFLNLFPRGAASGHLWAWPWPAASLCWSQLDLALLDVGEASGSSYKNLYSPLPT